MKKIVLLAAVLFYSAALSAQTATDSVKATINRMFEAMKEADSAKLRSCFADSAIMQTISRNREGKELVRTDGVDGFVKMVGSIARGVADERIVFGVVKTDGALGIAWTPYKFYRNGVFSHCGVNSFQLVRINHQWVIQYIIDTRRKDNCPE
ncbi:MAG: hypothetical protein I8H66_10625 [Sphingobacteriia bacterium]|nr:hypothetical protein [Sphingobacteriia bacterium]